MKLNNLFLSLLAGAALLSATSCNGKGDDPKTEPVNVFYEFSFPVDVYNTEGYWKEVYNPAEGAFGVEPTAVFSHNAQVTEYDGVTYKSFTGFCPSVVNDNTDHSGDDWTLYQFGSMSDTGGLAGYLIAHWDVTETDQTELAKRSCSIDFQIPVNPVALTVNNTAYTYWVMKKGSAFSSPFGSDDWLALDITGVNADGKAVSRITVDLASHGNAIDKFTQVDLQPLGKNITAIYFTMRSSDTGQWGMNTPAYFALGSIYVVYPGN